MYRSARSRPMFSRLAVVPTLSRPMLATGTIDQGTAETQNRLQQFADQSRPAITARCGHEYRRRWREEKIWAWAGFVACSLSLCTMQFKPGM